MWLFPSWGRFPHSENPAYQAVGRVTCDRAFHVRTDQTKAVDLSPDCAPLAELTDEHLFGGWDHV